MLSITSISVILNEHSHSFVLEYSTSNLSFSECWCWRNMEFWETERRRSPVHLNAEQKHRVSCAHKAQQSSQALSKDICSDWLLQPTGTSAKREEQQLPVLSGLSTDKHNNQSERRMKTVEPMTFDLRQKLEQFVSSFHKKDSMIHNCWKYYGHTKVPLVFDCRFLNIDVQLFRNWLMCLFFNLM